MTTGHRGGKPGDSSSKLKKEKKRARRDAAADPVAATGAAPPSAAEDAGGDFGDAAFFDGAAAVAASPVDGEDGLSPLPALGEEEEGEGAATATAQPLEKKKKAHPKRKPGAAAWAARSAALAGLADAAPAEAMTILCDAYAEATGGGDDDPDLAGLRARGGPALLPLPPPGPLSARLARADPALASALSAPSSSTPPPPVAAPLVLALSASANHCLDVRRSGLPRAVKLFARHIKVGEQASLLASPAGRAGCVTAVGTPARVLALLDAGALSLDRLRLLILDTRRDAKQRTVLDLPETKGEVWALVVRGGVGGRLAGGEARMGLFESSSSSQEG